MTDPIVLVEIDRDSRLRVLRHPGVMVALLDLRVDPHIVILPEVEMAYAAIAIHDATVKYAPISVRSDDRIHTAAHTVDRLRDGDIVVAGFERAKEFAP